MSYVYSQTLDSKSNCIVLIKLYKNVKNVVELRREILNGKLNCCILKPSLIVDPFQIVVAANKAIITKKLTTKTIYTELLFNLSISKNITESLRKFGIDDKENNIIVVVIKRKDDENSNESEIYEKVDGDEEDLKELTTYSDVGLIRKTYKINDVEYKKIPILNSITSRIATKDVLAI